MTHKTGDYFWYCKCSYIPTYQEGLTEEQLETQRTVLNFKDGIYTEEIKDWFLKKCRWIVRDLPTEYTVCFIPSSSGTKTHERRFKDLYEYLSQNLECEVYLDDTEYRGKKAVSHRDGKDKATNKDTSYNIAISADHFFMKNVILIDDIITTGRTFRELADLMMDFGAASITGLFLAQTVHPRSLKRNTEN